MYCHESFCRRWLVGILLAMVCSSGTAKEEERYVAYIESIVAAQHASQPAVRVRHAGTFVDSVGVKTGLSVGDEIFVRDEKVFVTVRMVASGATLTIFKSTHPGPAVDWTVPDPGVAGAPASLLSWLISLLDSSEPAFSETPGGVRGSQAACSNSSETNAPTPFQVPVLMAPHSYLVSGHRALVLAWRGGVAPFDVNLIRLKDGKSVAAQHVNRCVAQLPAVDLQLGQYRIVVTDARQVEDEQNDVRVVSTGPALPPPLSTGGPPDIADSLYFASWLMRVDGRTWALEGLQRAASLDCTHPAVKDWLDQWGATELCSPLATHRSRSE